MQIHQDTMPEFHTGHGTVGTAAAQVSTLAFRAGRKVEIKADLGNADNVYVGHGPNVTSSNGFQLDAGERVEIPIDDLTKVYVYGGASSQGYSWLVI